MITCQWDDSHKMNLHVLVQYSNVVSRYTCTCIYMCYKPYTCSIDNSADTIRTITYTIQKYTYSVQRTCTVCVYTRSTLILCMYTCTCIWLLFADGKITNSICSGMGDDMIHWLLSQGHSGRAEALIEPLTKSNVLLLCGKLPDNDVTTFDVVVYHMLCLRAHLHTRQHIQCIRPSVHIHVHV